MPEPADRIGWDYSPFKRPLRRDQMEMILHQDITMHFHPVALPAFSGIAQKLPSISFILKVMRQRLTRRTTPKKFSCAKDYLIIPT
jgi:hypothetical protein